MSLFLGNTGVPKDLCLWASQQPNLNKLETSIQFFRGSGAFSSNEVWENLSYILMKDSAAWLGWSSWWLLITPFTPRWEYDAQVQFSKSRPTGAKATLPEDAAFFLAQAGQKSNLRYRVRRMGRSQRFWGAPLDGFPAVTEIQLAWQGVRAYAFT